MNRLILRTFIAFCCLALPGYFVWEMVWSYYAQQRLVQVEQLKEEMETSLEPLVSLHEDKRFFHSFFSSKFKSIDQKNFSEIKLKRFLKKFSKAFPGIFEFIVWNDKDKVASELTDIEGYRYVFKTLLQTLKRIKAAVERGKTFDDGGIIEDRTMVLLRGFMGQFLLEERLRQFFTGDENGRAATVSESESRRLFWAYVGRNFSIGVFIHAAILKKRLGPNLLIQRHNRENRHIKLGCFSPCDFRFFGIPFTASHRNEILIEAKKFEDFALGFKETENFLLLIKKASPDFVAFSYVQKANLLLEPGQETGLIFFSILKWALIVAFILFCYLLGKPLWSLKIRYRLLLLLILVNGLPTMILLSAGYSFFNQKRAVTIFDQQQKSLQILREFDMKYLSQNERLAQVFNHKIDSLNLLYKHKPWPEHEIADFQKFLEEQKPSSYLLLDRNNTEFLEKQFQQRLIKLYLLASLFHVENNLDEFIRRFDSDTNNVAGNGFGQQAFWWVTNNLGNIFPQSFGLDHGYSYTNLLGNEDRSKNWAIFVVRWGKGEFLNIFCDNNLASFSAEVKPRITGVVDLNSEKIYCTVATLPRSLFKICKSAQLKKTILKSNVMINDKRYLLAATSSLNAKDSVFFCLYPVRLVNSEIFSLKLKITLLLIIVVLLMIQIGWYFSGRMLNPVDELHHGLEKIRRNEFDFAIVSRANDELGKMVDVFNSAICSLKDLNFGTTVQESLFPKENFSHRQVELFARSLFMTKMGGDYFDYFMTGEDKLVIFFGDVSGHGIPAAVIMAMVKASIMNSSAEYESPAQLLAETGYPFSFLKSKKYRRMMTACCLEINTQTGEYAFANAGHCFPLVVSKNGENLQELRLIGLPLGVSSKRKNEEIRGKLLPGESLLFYTDGLIEGKDLHGRFIEIDGFKNMIRSNWHNDLKLSWESIINSSLDYAGSQDDDLTILILRYEI